MKRRVALAAALLLVLSCGRKPKEETGKEVSKNPAVAVTQIGEAMQKATKAAQEAAQQKPVPPVKFDALLPFLPAPPSGWRADDAHGETSQGMGFTISTVRRHYRGPGTLQVTITDSGFHPMVLAGVTMAAQFAKETTEGYERGVTLDGNPGIEHWRNDGSHSQLTLVVGKRFLLEMRAAHVPEGFLRSVFESMDRKGLADLK